MNPQYALTYRELSEDLVRGRHPSELQLEECPFALFLVDMTGRYLEVNSKGAALTGYGREELIGMSLLRLFFPDDLALGAQQFQRLREKGLFSGDLQIRRKDGSPGRMHLDAFFLGEERFVAFGFDPDQEAL